MILLKLLQYIFLGVIQGFTEPIPISSSGHLLLVKKIFKFNMLNDINFEIVVNFGSFIAIFFLYREEIIKLIRDFIKFIIKKDNDSYENYKYVWLIMVATVPAGIIGLIFKEKIELISGNIKLIGFALIITALSLYLIKDIKGKKDKKDITFKDAILVGLFQVIALFPGISRSGSTIVGAMFCDLDRKTAVNYSFMLYMPISVATLLLGVSDLIKTPNIESYFLPYLISMLVSMLVTYYSAKWFINIMKRGKLIYFSIYCLIVGLMVLILI